MAKFTNNQLIVGSIVTVVAIALLYMYVYEPSGPIMQNEGKVATEPALTSADPAVQPAVSPMAPAGIQGAEGPAFASSQGVQGRDPYKTCLDAQGQWISTNLLPKEDPQLVEDWNVVTPGNLSDQNFLEAGFHLGVDSIANTLKNANYQLRSEPPNPQVKVSPWMQSSYEPDPYRRSFEIDGI
jgi:hypothetical protein